MKKKTIRSMQKTALTAALLLEISASTHAAEINVDNNTCTLFDAITAANTDTAIGGCASGNGSDVIELPTDSVITLSQSLPAIINDVTINANGSTINRDSGAADFSVIQLGSTANVSNQPILTLNDATITGGSRANNYGGGINVFLSTLILNDSIISNNVGGGITLTRSIDSEVNRSIINNNLSFPGGIYYGGALSMSGGTLNINDSTIADNTSNSGLGGGGIYTTDLSGPLVLTITNSTISNNATTSDGGGIIHYLSSNPSSSDITLNNCTIVNNQSGGSGGGIYADTADFDVNQSIIAGNTANLTANEIIASGGTFALDDYNLIGLNGNSDSTGITIGSTDLVPSENNLSDVINTSLANNGGPTPTHNLVVDSPAIDAITTGNCTTANDQVGNIRGNDGDGDMTGKCDIGAVEYQPIIDLIFTNDFESPPN